MPSRFLAGVLRLRCRPIPVIAEQKAVYEATKTNLIKAAEKMPEEAYSFQTRRRCRALETASARIANQG
jgi:hypothetical protein